LSEDDTGLAVEFERLSAYEVGATVFEIEPHSPEQLTLEESEVVGIRP
jgi:hypothetical protein